MNFLVKSIGWILVLVGLAALGYDAMILLDKGTFKISVWGELWYELHPASLNLYQAVIERYIHPVIWDEFLAPLLFYKAFYLFTITGLVLVTFHRIIYLFKRVFMGADEETA